MPVFVKENLRYEIKAPSTLGDKGKLTESWLEARCAPTILPDWMMQNAI
jgi:hypothetical protein